MSCEGVKIEVKRVKDSRNKIFCEFVKKRIKERK